MSGVLKCVKYSHVVREIGPMGGEKLWWKRFVAQSGKFLDCNETAMK